MSFIVQVIEKIKFKYRLYIQREPFLLEVQRWFANRGDETLRLDYELDTHSVVFDIGGYQGDFAQDIFNKFGCTVYIFEPVKEYFEICLKRFRDNPKIIPLNFGLSSSDSTLDILVAENASSFFKPIKPSSLTEVVTLRNINTIIEELGIDHIDLFKINIEGGEFDVLPSLIHGPHITKVKNIQIQFHNFVENAEYLRDEIRLHLLSTHSEMWCYKFVWESWTSLKA